MRRFIPEFVQGLRLLSSVTAARQVKGKFASLVASGDP